MSIIDIETENSFHLSKIDEIEPLEENINTVFKIMEQNEIREIYKRYTGETQRVCDFIVADETAKIILTLWQDDIDEVEVDQVYKLENGFANIYQNNLRLTKGRSGTLTKHEGEITDINIDVDKSSVHIEDPRRKRRRRVESSPDRYRYRPRNNNRNERRSWQW